MRVTTSLCTALLAATVASPAAAYEVAPVSNGGSIKGKVTFTGSPPAPRKIIPTKDKEVCGGVREVPQIAVGPDKGVQDAIVYLKEVEKGKAWDKAAKPPEIDNQACDFKPHVQVMPAGDIDIVNSDPVLHNTHGFYGKPTGFNLALPNQGQRITKPLKKPGLVRVECDAHGWMLGLDLRRRQPVLRDHGKDGTFSITDVPPGSTRWSPGRSTPGRRTTRHREGQGGPRTSRRAEEVAARICSRTNQEGGRHGAEGSGSRSQAA